LILIADLLVLVLPVESAFLFALLAGDGGAVLFLRVRAPLTLAPDERRYYVAVLARVRLPVRFHVRLTLLTNRRRRGFTAPLSLCYYFSRSRTK
jgi:hypothetical protein